MSVTPASTLYRKFCACANFRAESSAIYRFAECDATCIQDTIASKEGCNESGNLAKDWLMTTYRALEFYYLKRFGMSSGDVPEACKWYHPILPFVK